MVVGGSTAVISSASLTTDGTHSVVHFEGGSRPLVSFAVAPPLQPAVRMLRLGPRALAAGLLLPRDHRPGTSLPVLVDPYGGPHAQRVVAARSAWQEPQWLADQGFAVLVVDGRGTPGRDAGWEREIHHDLVGPVLEDQVDALQAAAEIEPDLDLRRVGDPGLVLRWLAGRAGGAAPPRCLLGRDRRSPGHGLHALRHLLHRTLSRHPAGKPRGVRHCSLLDDAATLSRPLLIIHGLADDNVVAAHTLRLSQRLTEAGRPHSVLPLTGVTHMTPQEAVAENLLLLQVEFLQRHLSAATP